MTSMNSLEKLLKWMAKKGSQLSVESQGDRINLYLGVKSSTGILKVEAVVSHKELGLALFPLLSDTVERMAERIDAKDSEDNS